MKKILISICLTAIIFIVGSFKNQSDIINVKNSVFEVAYSQVLEQPLWLVYSSTNRPTLVNRKSMDFYVEKNIHTSDGLDYLSNVYDRVIGCATTQLTRAMRPTTKINANEIPTTNT